MIETIQLAGNTKRVLRVGEVELSIVSGPIWSLKLVRGSEILLAELRPSREREKLMTIFDLLAIGLESRGGGE